MPGDGALVKSRGFSGLALQWRSVTAVGILRVYQERPMTGGWFWGFRHHVKALDWPAVHVLLNFVLQPPGRRRWKRDPFCEPSLLIGRWVGRILFCFIRMLPPTPRPPPAPRWIGWKQAVDVARRLQPRRAALDWRASLFTLPVAPACGKSC